jgi:hypothetical protein
MGIMILLECELKSGVDDVCVCVGHGDVPAEVDDAGVVLVQVDRRRGPRDVDLRSVVVNILKGR